MVKVEIPPEFPTAKDEKNLKEKYGNRISVWIPCFGLGDTICATPTLREIRRSRNDYKMTVGQRTIIHVRIFEQFSLNAEANQF